MNPRMPHLPAQSWELFLRDELSAEATGRIEAHLADCAECSAALEREDPSFLFRRNLASRHACSEDCVLIP